MSMLLKYEFRKTWFMKLVILGITAVAELLFLGGLLFGDVPEGSGRLVSISILLLTLIAVFGVMVIGIQSVLVLHRDMNTKQGYMLYMTPRNSYQILGAKMLENGLSLLLAGAFFALLAILDVTLLFSRMGQLESLLKAARDMLRMMGTEIPLNRDGFLCLMLSFLTSWLGTVSIAFLADIISAALLNGKKFNGLVSFLLFILLSIAMGWLQNALNVSGNSVTASLLTSSAVALAYSVGMYVLSAWIMERWLSV